MAALAAALIAAGFSWGKEATAGLEKTAVQRLSMSVRETCTLSVDGNPGKLTVKIGRAANGTTPETAVAEVQAQYTVIAARGRFRILTARLENPDSPPPGCLVTLQAVPAGKKNEGQSVGPVVLSGIPQAILTDIGTCATGTGPADGARLIFARAGGGTFDSGGDEGLRMTVILELR